MGFLEKFFTSAKEEEAGIELNEADFPNSVRLAIARMKEVNGDLRDNGVWSRGTCFAEDLPGGGKKYTIHGHVDIIIGGQNTKQNKNLTVEVDAQDKIVFADQPGIMDSN